MKRTLSCLFAVQLTFFAQRASAAETPKEEVRALMQRYNEVEAELDRSVHYIKKEGAEPETTVRQAWFNQFGGLLKVATERVGAAGRELNEYFPFEPDENPKAMRMFVLIRRERPRPHGATRVEEERLYLRRSEARLLTLRKLTKSAEFKAGATLDMEHVRNVVVAPAKRTLDAITEEAAKRDWDFMEEPKNIAQALRAAGPPDRAPSTEGTEVAAEKKEEKQPVNTASPDGQWELARAAPDDPEQSANANFIVRKRASPETSVTLSEEAAGTFDEAARIVWSPDSKRFAFHYKPGLRYQTLQLFQLDGDTWRELDSPDDEETTAPVHRSMAAQRKKLKLPPKEGGRPISDTCQIRRWVDANTALLLAEKNETFQINNELEQVGESCFLTLKFEPNGDWKVIRTRLVSGAKTGDLNQVEREELQRMEKEWKEEE